MGSRTLRASLITGLLVAGCASPATLPAGMVVQPGMDPALLGDATTPRYSVMAAPDASDKVTITNVVASSTRNSYFPVSYVTDTNMSSAWAPAYSDASPTLTFDLATSVALTGMAIKTSPDGVLIDVAVQNAEGEWVTVATDVDPEVATLDWVDLSSEVESDRVRLTFHGELANEVLVCAVEFYGEEGTLPSPEPTPTPTPTPVVTPTPTPTATPTPPPAEEDCGCKVTGGGWVFSPNTPRGKKKNDHTSFGFVAMTNPGQGVHGNIQVTDHPTNTKFHGRVDGIDCDENTVTFVGSLKDGTRFTATVTDNGEPGSEDVFSFTAGSFSVSGNLGEDGPRGGGNIQVHKPKCD